MNFTNVSQLNYGQAGEGIILLNETTALVLGSLGQLITKGLLKTFFSTRLDIMVLLYYYNSQNLMTVLLDFLNPNFLYFFSLIWCLYFF